MRFTFSEVGLGEARARLQRFMTSLHDLTGANLAIADVIHKRAWRYCPKSPTKGALRKLKKLQAEGISDPRTGKIGYWTPTTKSRASYFVENTDFYREHMEMFLEGGGFRELPPGTLEDSIIYKADATGLAVFIPANGAAGAYADVIHNQRGVRWQELGPGSQAKGPQCGDRFIYRAADDTRDEGMWDAIMENHIARAKAGRIAT